MGTGPSLGSPQLSPRLRAVSIIKAHAGEMVPVPKVLSLQVRGLALNPQNSCKRNWRVMAHVCNPSAGEAEKGRLPGLNCYASLDYMESSRLV